MAVLPPTDESTWANSVVGIWINEMPRKYAEATKPEISPTTPPPIAMIPSDLSKLWAIKKLIIFWKFDRDFAFSPWFKIIVNT